jgi:hypothetical protein
MSLKLTQIFKKQQKYPGLERSKHTFKNYRNENNINY